MRTRRWLAALLSLVLVAALAAPAMAASGQSELDRAVETLNRYGIVQGDPSGNMRLNDPITRAEFMKVLIAAAGEGRQAQLLQGAQAFSDTANHWASGYIAVAKQMGIAGGYPDGTFRPDDSITNAEVVALLTRLAEVELISSAWPEGYIRSAERAGIIPAGLDLTLVANVPATRGAAFLLAHRAFSEVANFDGGLTLYQKTFDSTPPALAIDEVPEATTASSVTIAGQAKDAAEVTVNGRSAPLDSSGRFVATVNLEMGENVVTVRAADDLGNVAEEQLTVQRSSGTPATIEVPRRLTLQVGETVPLEVTVEDGSGFAIPNADVTAQSDLVTYDPITRTITATGATGTGTLTLQAGEATATVSVTVASGAPDRIEVTTDKQSVAVGEQAQVTVTAYDAGGNEVTGYDPRFTVSSAWALINQNGIFAATRPGIYTVNASIGSVTGSIEIGVYDNDPADLRLDGPKTIVGNGEPVGPFTVSVVDRNGAVIANATNTVDLEFSDAKIVDEAGRELNTVQLEDGQATFYLQADAGYWGLVLDLRAEDADDPDLADSLEVEIVEQDATAVKTVDKDEYLAANDGTGKAVLRFAVVDQAGSPVLDGSWDLDFEIRGPAIEADSQEKTGTIYYYGGEPAELVLDALTGQTGTITVEVSGPGLGSVTERVQAVISRSPERLRLSFNDSTATVSTLAGPNDGGVEITVAVTDANGVPVPYYDDVYVDFSNPIEDVNEDQDFSYSRDDRNDDGYDDRVILHFRGENRARFWVSSEKAGTMQVSVRAADGDLASVSGEVAFSGGPAARAGFDRSRVLLPVTDTDGTLTVRLYDEYGNPARQGGVEIEIVGEDPSGDPEDNIRIAGRRGEATVTTSSDGTATFEYWVRPGLKDYRFQINDVSGDMVVDSDRREVEVTVTATVPATLDVQFADAYDPDARQVSAYAGYVGADAYELDEVVLKVTLEDQYGGGLGDYGVADITDFLEVQVEDYDWDIDNDGVADSAADVEEYLEEQWELYDDGVFLSRPLIPATAGTTTVNVTLDVAAEPLVDTGVLRIRPGYPAKLILAEATLEDGVPTIHLKEDQIKAFTLRVADRYGNVTSGRTTYEALIYPESGLDLYVRRSASGADLTGDYIEVRSATSIYLLLANEDSGYITITASGLEDSRIYVNGSD